MTTAPIQSRADGFTLLELLVGMAVMSLFLVLASQVVTSSLTQWELANQRIHTNLQARLVFDWLSRDIQTLCLNDDDSEWLRVIPQDINDDRGHLIKGSKFMGFCQPGQPQKDPASTSSTSPRISGPVAVAYALGNLDPMVKDGTRKQFALLRTSVNPRDTFENMGVGNLDTDFWAEGVMGFTTIRPEDILAENIVGFRIVAEFFDNKAGAIRRSDPSQTFIYGPEGTIKVGAVVYPDASLTAFEVTIWILDRRTSIRLQSSGNFDWSTPAHTFSKRIPIISQ